MGNTESNVTSGVKKQAGTSLQKLYKLVDIKGKFERQRAFFYFVKLVLCYFSKSETQNGDDVDDENLPSLQLPLTWCRFGKLVSFSHL